MLVPALKLPFDIVLAPPNRLNPWTWLIANVVKSTGNLISTIQPESSGTGTEKFIRKTDFSCTSEVFLWLKALLKSVAGVVILIVAIPESIVPSLASVVSTLNPENVAVEIGFLNGVTVKLIMLPPLTSVGIAFVIIKVSPIKDATKFAPSKFETAVTENPLSIIESLCDGIRAPGFHFGKVTLTFPPATSLLVSVKDTVRVVVCPTTWLVGVRVIELRVPDVAIRIILVDCVSRIVPVSSSVLKSNVLVGVELGGFMTLDISTWKNDAWRGTEPNVIVIILPTLEQPFTIMFVGS